MSGYGTATNDIHPRLSDAEMMANLRKENTKMRELVVDVHESLRADKAGMFHKLILVSMEDDMRELGIEVNE